ncbi:MAG TPA: ubiquinol-cytochrome c reductase iron-sulfur subunit [Gemmataceae bacterium]|jgi:menaquinol-cytochrome c reductase iron-sulfur subunit|nr:ubiquinol-cytochrome c reductase iron-sulfur subunit [Gemmataceae bacterium]
MHPDNLNPPPHRRSFLKWATHGLGVLFGVLLGIPAVAYLIDPRNRPAPNNDFQTVARLSELRKGVPHQVVIRDIRQDAWTLHPNDVIGRVWLVRGEGDKVDAFTTTCPHLGCSVNFEAKENLFLCPCHGGTFLLNGQRKELTERTNPAPRGMDKLEIKTSEDPDPAHLVDGKRDALVAVKYQNFIQGKEIPVLKK